MLRLPVTPTASSEHSGHPASSLVSAHARTAPGWSSRPGAPGPHWLDLAVGGGASASSKGVTVEVLQMLAHERRVPRRADVWVRLGAGGGEPFLAGFVEFGDNAVTGYLAREMLAVDLNAAVMGREVVGVRIVFGPAWPAPGNEEGLVGIMGVALLGHNVVHDNNNSSSDVAAPPLPTHVSGPPMPGFTGSPSQHLSQRVREIRALKEDAAAREAYDEAKSLREREHELQRLLEQALDLEAKKAEAVAREDYDDAKRIKAKLENLVSRRAHEAGTTVDEENNTVQPTTPTPPSPRAKSGLVHGRAAVLLATPPHVPAHSVDMLDTLTGQTSPPPPGFWGDLDPENAFPVAESLTGPRDEALISALGEYLVRCLKSTHVKLRQAALTRVERDVRAASDYSTDEAEAVLRAVVMGLSDSAPHVFVAGARLLDAIVHRVGGSIISQDLIAEHAQDLADRAVDALHSSHQIVVDAARDVLTRVEELLQPNSDTVMAKALFRPAGKNPKALQGRLQVLAHVLERRQQQQQQTRSPTRRGPASASASYLFNGFSVDRVFEWASKHEVFQHSNALVREAARAAMVALHAGLDPVEGVRLESLLRGVLRPSVLETYMQAFHVSPLKAGRPLPVVSAAPPHPKPVPAPTISSRAAVVTAPHDDDQEDQDEEETCEYCGIRVPPEEAVVIDGEKVSAMDRHHWQDCPMLTTCTRCEQVCPISNLNEHLLTECEMRANHRPCPRCGEAIAAQFFQQHVARARCLPQQPPSVANRCPLCHLDIDPFESGWATHILAHGCPKNPRTVVSGGGT